MKRPNILLYCTDQQRFDTIGRLGNPFVQTPTLDRLVDQGTAFDRAYCQSPICTPSRSSFMTGLPASRVRNCRNGNENFDHHPPLISKMLADAGYDCGLVGKFHLQSSGRRTEPRMDDGFRYWKFSHAPRDDWKTGHDYAEWVREQGGDLDALRESDDRVPTDLHQTTWTTQRAIEFIDESREGPWFLNLNPYDPHPPFIPPRSYRERFDASRLPGPHFEPGDLEQQRQLADVAFQTLGVDPSEFDGQEVQALYYAMIAQIDDQFERLLHHLQATQQLDNTLIIFTSDHGEMLGDHGLLYKGCRFYEGLVRVPLIFSWPGKIASGVIRESLVELTDMSATILDFAGLETPETFEGRSLRPLLENEQADDHHREFVRCEYFDALDEFFVQGSLSYGTMLRNDRYKLVVYHTHGLGELYDLHEDPWEFRNLWDAPQSAAIKQHLMEASFNATVMEAVDTGTRRIAPM